MGRGPLQDDFSRILLEDLSSLLRGNRVSLYVWPGTGTVDYRLGVDVVRFDGIPGGDVILIANWALREGRSNKVVKVQSSRIQEPTGAQSYEAMVGGMSGALGRLSLEIGEAIKVIATVKVSCQKGMLFITPPRPAARKGRRSQRFPQGAEVGNAATDNHRVFFAVHMRAP